MSKERYQFIICVVDESFQISPIFTFFPELLKEDVRF